MHFFALFTVKVELTREMGKCGKGWWWRERMGEVESEVVPMVG